MKNVIIAGASGMIGGLILEECISSNEVNKVISLVRNKSGKTDPKVEEVIISDFADLSFHSKLFEKVDAAFFCIGVYTGQVPDEMFKKITVDSNRLMFEGSNLALLNCVSKTKMGPLNKEPTFVSIWRRDKDLNST